MDRQASFADEIILMSVSRNISWTFASRMASQAVSIGFSVFIARLVTPTEYGLIGMLTVLSGFAFTIGEGGIGAALIYLGRNDQETLSTAFWLQFAINIAFTILFFCVSEPIAQFYDTPALAPLTRLMSILFVIQSLGQVQVARLTQDMNFKAIAIATFVATLASSACALLLALQGWGVWALAWQAIANVVIMLVATSIYSRWRPQFVFSFKMARQIASYSLYLLGNNTINYWLRNGDNLLIGKFLGASPLGLYNRAYSLMLLPLGNIGSVLGQVMFPTLSRMRDDRPAFRAMYLQSLRVIAFVTFPIMGGLSILAGPLLLLLYGSQWVGAVPVLQVLSLVGLLQCIIFPVGWIYNALGHNRAQFTATLILAPIFIVLIFGGLRYGLMGVTWGYAIWAVISALLNIHMAGRLIGVSISEYILLVAPKAIATLVMMVVVWLVEPMLLPALGLFPAVFFCSVIGFVVYVANLTLLRDGELKAAVARGRTFLRPGR